jgi:glycosyl transferase, family 25
MDVYVMHYSPLKERKEHILKECERERINPIFITEYDRDVLTEKDISKFRLDHKFKLSHVSIILKHVCTWKKIVSDNIQYALILEDDAILASNFLKKLNLCLEQLPSDFDILMINEGCDLHIPASMLTEGKYVYERGLYPTLWGGDGATRCTDGYIISNKCALQLIDTYESLTNKIDLPTDLWMNKLLRFIDAKAYWAEPTLMKQGTGTGLFQSSY